MARTRFGGFENGTYHFETAASGGASTTGTAPTVVSGGDQRSGVYALRISPSSGTTSGVGIPSVFTNFSRIYVRITARPATTARVLIGTTLDWNIRLNPNGTLGLYNGSTLQTAGTSTTALTDTARWYRIEWRGAANVPVKIDGVDEMSPNSGFTVSMSLQLGAWSDTVADTYTAYFDDWACDDAAFPGEGKVALLIPTAQNSVTASTWQKPGGATTNMHTSVDNTPPIGVANSTNVAQAENQIRNAVSNATADVVFAMTTYTAAGIPGPITPAPESQLTSDGSSGIIQFNKRYGQSFQASGDTTISTVEVAFIKTGSPTDNIVVEIRTDESGLPSATVLASSSLAATGVSSTSSANPTTLTFPFSQAISGSTPYWIVVSRSGSTDGANFVSVVTKGTASSYANGVLAEQSVNSPFSWTTTSTIDVRFRVTFTGQTTINATQAFALVGLATTATTKTGSLETTNPAQAEANFGAYGTGAAVGTFPTNWQRRDHTITQNPTPTLGTAPTIEVGQRTANTTIAQVCFVGMYVDYTPAAAPDAMVDPMGMSGFFGG